MLRERDGSITSVKILSKDRDGNQVESVAIVKLGYVYIAEFDGLVKIGLSREPRNRIKNLVHSTGRNVLRSWVSEPMLHWRKFENFLHEEFAEDRKLGEYFSSKFDAVVSFAKESQRDFLGTDEEIEEKARRSLKTADGFNWMFRSVAKRHQDEIDKQDRNSLCLLQLRNAWLEFYLMVFGIRFKNIIRKKAPEELMQRQIAFLLGKIKALSDVLVFALCVPQEAIVAIEEFVIEECSYVTWSNFSEDEFLDMMGDEYWDDVFGVLGDAILESISDTPDTELVALGAAFADSRCSEDMGLVDSSCDHDVAWKATNAALAASSLS